MPGLRREEVAMLTRVSVKYYARMERGDLAGVSTEVLDALAATLKLDGAETAYLHDLARVADSPRPRRRERGPQQGVRPSLCRFLDSITESPAWICDRRTTIIAANPLGHALYAPIIEDAATESNTARFVFFDPDAEVFFPDWDRVADEIVCALRSYARHFPHDRMLTNLIGELATRSDEFRTRWGGPRPCFPGAGIKRLHHPLVGDLELHQETLDVPADPDRFLFAYTAEPATPSAERLQLLGNLAASDNANYAAG